MVLNISTVHKYSAPVRSHVVTLSTKNYSDNADDCECSLKYQTHQETGSKKKEPLVYPLSLQMH